MSKPVFGVNVGGVDITGKLAGGGISMTITDGVGLKSDTCQLTIDDVDGVIAAPSTGAVIAPFAGYDDGRVRQFGQYIIDQVSFSGYPSTIMVRAQSVGAMSLAKRRTPKDYRAEEYPTYRKIFEEIAGRAGLALAMAGQIGSIPNEYEAQGEERELEFVTRLGRKLDAAISVKLGRLVVVPRGSGMSVSGAILGPITVARGVNLLSYEATLSDKPKHSEVEATWYDRKANKRMVEKAPAGSGGPTFLIREPFQSQAEAKLAAAAQGRELKRGEGSATFSIDGDPFAQAGANVIVSGIRPKVDGLWTSKTVTHDFSSTSPYRTSIECEMPT